MKIKLGILILLLFIFHNVICGVDEECVVFLPKSLIKHSAIPELLDELHFSLSCSQLNSVNKPIAIVYNRENVNKYKNLKITVVCEITDIVPEDIKRKRLIFNQKPAEFFLIDSKKINDRINVNIKASNDRNLIYALFVLCERIIIEPNKALGDMNRIYSTPLKIRMASDIPENALIMGYNTVPTYISPTQIALFEDVDQDLFAINSEGYQRTVKNREKLREFVNNAKMDFIDIASISDEFLFPKEVLFSKYQRDITENDFNPEQVKLGWGMGRIYCFGKPMLWQFYRSKYKEFHRLFPDIKYSMLRLGENRNIGEAYIGCGVYAYGEEKYCSDCNTIPYKQRIAKTINETYDVVVKDSGKKYIHRTWDLKEDLMNANPELQRKILEMVPNKENLIFSTKYTITDFWKYELYNPTIDVNGVDRMIEFQCTREYEGKGAFPNFLGRDFVDAYRHYARNRHIVGIWNWHYGGGTGGPIVQTDIWNQANIYAARRLMWEPELGTEEIAKEWAILTFGSDSADEMAKLMLLSDKAITKMFYFEEYSKNHRKWTPNELWVRDDVIRGRHELNKIYDECKNSVDKIVAEKQEAIDIIYKMISILKSSKNDIVKSPVAKKSFEKFLVNKKFLKANGSSHNLYKYTLNTLEYELALAKVFKSYVASYFYFKKWKDIGDLKYKALASSSYDDWEYNWADYNSRIPKLNGVASLYKDEGMTKVMNQIKRHLSGIQDIAIKWMIIGPFDNSNKVGFDKIFDPEEDGFSSDKEYKSFNEIVKWKPYPEDLIKDGYIDISPVYEKKEWVMAYLYGEFESDNDKDAQIRVGSDDGIKVWLNGDLVIARDEYRAALEDDDIADVRLKKGKNIVLIKLTQGILGWGFYFRITDAEGMALKGIKSSK